LNPSLPDFFSYGLKPFLEHRGEGKELLQDLAAVVRTMGAGSQAAL
jgi:hypothetical protein